MHAVHVGPALMLQPSGVPAAMAGHHLQHHLPGVADGVARKTKLFVGGLSYTATDDDLFSHFSQFGDIIEAVVIFDRTSGRSRGYGFVTYTRPEAATRAMQEPSPIISGRKANVNMASGIKRGHASAASAASAAAAAAALAGGYPYGLMPMVPPAYYAMSGAATGGPSAVGYHPHLSHGHHAAGAAYPSPAASPYLPLSAYPAPAPAPAGGAPSAGSPAVTVATYTMGQPAPFVPGAPAGAAHGAHTAAAAGGWAMYPTPSVYNAGIDLKASSMQAAYFPMGPGMPQVTGAPIHMAPYQEWVAVPVSPTYPSSPEPLRHAPSASDARPAPAAPANAGNGDGRGKASPAIVAPPRPANPGPGLQEADAQGPGDAEEPGDALDEQVTAVAAALEATTLAQ